MIILYSLPNMLTMPYQIDGEKGFHTFRPGKNLVPDRIWEAIKSQHKARFDNYYSSILREFNLSPEAIEQGNDMEASIESKFYLPPEAIKPGNDMEASIESRFNLPPEAIEPPEEGAAPSRYNNFPTSSIDPPDEVQYFEPFAPKWLAPIFSTDGEGSAASGETLVDISSALVDISRIDQIRQDLDLIENTMGLEELDEEYRELTKAELDLIENTMELEEPDEEYRELTEAKLDLTENTMELEEPDKEYRELTEAKLDLIENAMGLEESDEEYRELTEAKLDLIENAMGLEEPGTCLHDEKHDERQLKRPWMAVVKANDGRIAEINDFSRISVQRHHKPSSINIGINDFAARIREKKGTAKVNELVQNSPAPHWMPPPTIAGHCREPTISTAAAHRWVPLPTIAGHCREPMIGTAAKHRWALPPTITGHRHDPSPGTATNHR